MKRLFILLFIIPLLLFSQFPLKVNAENQSTLPEEIIYDILVDRFNNGRQAPSEQVDVNNPLTYNGGDIKGITMMLDTLQEHGFTTISLSPIMENAERGYHGYWIEDFYAVEEEFGTMDDVKELVKEAHNRGMKVMLELVTNYVAKTSPLIEEVDQQVWFKENEVEPIEATTWLEDIYVFNQENEEVQEYLLDVAMFWVNEVDIDGFKLHAADQASPFFLEKLTTELKQIDPYFHIIATTLQENEDVADLYAIENIDAIANKSLSEKINEVFTFPDVPVSHLFENGEHSFRDLIYVDNMNTARFSNNFAENERNAVMTWTLALAYMYLTPGVPIIYQGSEVPMYGPGFPENQYFVNFTSADPDIKQVFEQMSALRDQFPALVYGDMEHIAVDDELSLFKRTLDGTTVWVAINNSSESGVVTISDLNADLQLRGLFHDDTIRQNENGEFLIGMERESAEVFVAQPNTGFNWGFILLVASIFIVFIVGVIILSRKQKKRELAAKQ